MQGSQEQRDGLIDSMKCPVFEVTENGHSSFFCLRCCGGPLYYRGTLLPKHTAHFCYNGLIEENKAWERPAFLVNHPARKAAKGKEPWIKLLGPTFEGRSIKKAQGQAAKAGKSAVQAIRNGPESEEEEEEESEEEDDEGTQSE